MHELWRSGEVKEKRKKIRELIMSMTVEEVDEQALKPDESPGNDVKPVETTPTIQADTIEKPPDIAKPEEQHVELEKKEEKIEPIENKVEVEVILNDSTEERKIPERTLRRKPLTPIHRPPDTGDISVIEID